MVFTKCIYINGKKFVPVVGSTKVDTTNFNQRTYLIADKENKHFLSFGSISFDASRKIQRSMSAQSKGSYYNCAINFIDGRNKEFIVKSKKSFLFGIIKEDEIVLRELTEHELFANSYYLEQI